MVFWLAGMALAAGEDDIGHRHAIAAGIGHHYGGLGGGYTYRATGTLDVGVGAGTLGIAGFVRHHPAPWKPLHVGVGISPLFVSELATYYGPDVHVGVDTRDKHIYLNAGAGFGFASVPLLGMQPSLVIDAGIGYNFHKPR